MSTSDLPSAPSGAIVREHGNSNETTQVARLLWLRSLFGDASSGRRMEALVARMTEFFIPQGKELYVAGTTTESMYFIIEGEIEHGTDGYTRYVSGDVLGFVDSMIDRPHRHTARVVEDAVVLRLKVDDWLEHLEENFVEVRNMITSFAAGADAYPDEEEESEQHRWVEQARHAPAGGAGQLVRRLLAVKTCPLFRRASIQSIAQLVRRATHIKLSQGTVLPAEHQRKGLFVLVSGRVHCALGAEDDVVSWETGTSGALLGSLTLMQQLPVIFDFTAAEDSELLYFDLEDYFDVMEDHFDVARSVFGYFGSRAEARNYRRAQAERN